MADTGCLYVKIAVELNASIEIKHEQRSRSFSEKYISLRLNTSLFLFSCLLDFCSPFLVSSLFSIFHVHSRLHQFINASVNKHQNLYGNITQTQTKQQFVHLLITTNFKMAAPNHNAVRAKFERNSVLDHFRVHWREKIRPLITVQIDLDFDRNMQFGDRNRRKSKPTKLEDTENAGKYVHGLQMYKVPPTDNITLEEFEEFAIDRLKGT